MSTDERVSRVASTEQLTPEVVIARIEEWSGADVRLEPLGGGITNHNFLVHVSVGPDHPHEAQYVMRIPGEGTDLFIDRGNERARSIAAAEAGVAPRVVHAVGDALVIAFIEAQTMHPDTLAGHPDRLVQIVEA